MDRTDREYAELADVDALARGVNTSSRARFGVSVRGATSRSAGAPMLTSRALSWPGG